jgi:membrane associated rhomboid family serine protease
MTGEAFPDRFKRWYATLPPAMRVLLTINTALYFVWVIILLTGPRILQRFIVDILALHAVAPDVLLRPWQVLTYGFVHLRDGLWGFIAFGFNMLWLYWIGRDYEETYGSYRLFALYVLATVGGGVLVVAGAFLLPPANIPVAGALVAVLGVLCGVATLSPNRGMGLFLLGVVPMKWIAIGFLVLAVLFFAGTWPYMFAYLGAAATGFVFARAQLAGYDLASWARPLFPRSPGGYTYSSGSSAGGGTFKRMQGWVRGKRKEEAPLTRAGAGKNPSDQVPQKSGNDVVDRLLDKISERGYDSLTPDEKQILYKASRNE